MSKTDHLNEQALVYHEYSSHDRNRRKPGKIEVIPTKVCLTQKDLSLAYSPGVAAASMAIAENPERVSDFTIRSNLVAVVTNGTAVLGLGNIGPLASKPVMEGKGVLFKKFANINVFDIELNAPSPDDVIRACQMLEPTVGGINLEDIKAPDCFIIEEALRKSLKIPVFHDDQHGTAIIVAAAIQNGLLLAKKKIKNVRFVFSGAGAAAIACAELLITFGARRDKILLCDQKGVVHSGRSDLDPYKARFATKTSHRSIRDALKGADVFVGLSVAGIIKPEMVKAMASRPLIFGLANPDPEIPYEDAKRARKDAIVATGRSDYPNQINNVLGFPSVFRGALDVEASCINEEMKVAAAKALAALAREDVPDSVSRVYGGQHFVFGPDYIIPKPFDSRVLLWVAPAVAEAAIRTKVAGKRFLKNFRVDDYRESLALTLDKSRHVMQVALSKARRSLAKIVLPEGDHPKILKAAIELSEEKICEPILIGSPKIIHKVLEELQLKAGKIRILNPEGHDYSESFASELYEIRQRKGLLLREAQKLMLRRTYFGLMLVRRNLADGMVSGLTKTYPETIRPTLQIIAMNEKYRVASGLYILLVKDRVLFFADTTVNIEPTAEELAEIALQTADKVSFFGLIPKIAMLSFANFGSSPHPMNDRIQKAVEIVHQRAPKLEIDGEMQADTAVWASRLGDYAFSKLREPANVLIFPDLASGNIAYKLLQHLGNAEVIGPILMGPRKPVHILQQGSSVEEIVRMATIAAAEANEIG